MGTNNFYPLASIQEGRIRVEEEPSGRRQGPPELRQNLSPPNVYMIRQLLRKVDGETFPPAIFMAGPGWR